MPGRPDAERPLRLLSSRGYLPRSSSSSHAGPSGLSGLVDAPRLLLEPELRDVGARRPSSLPLTCRVPAGRVCQPRIRVGRGQRWARLAPPFMGDEGVFVVTLARRNTTCEAHCGTRAAEKMPEMVSTISLTESGRGGEVGEPSRTPEGDI